jgi:hypothetical protein
VSPATNWSLGALGGGRPWLSADGDQLTVYTGVISSNDPFDATSWTPRLTVLPAGLRFSFR